jgi:hypothetical protein
MFYVFIKKEKKHTLPRSPSFRHLMAETRKSNRQDLKEV